MKLFNSFNKIVLVVEYDGSHYYGFQWQAKLPTIQAELERAIQKLTGDSRRVMAASRTDTGVHARRQVVSFRTNSTLPDKTFVSGLNYYLPKDIAVKAACKVGEDFSIRRDALSREYDYLILNIAVRSPLREGFTYLVKNKLNVNVMNEACSLLEGEHDFASFTTSLSKEKRTIRTVYKAGVKREDDMVTFHIVADSFLPHQVRNTVGLLIRVGLSKVELGEVDQILKVKTPGLAGPAAPACGLYLTKVNYARDLELKYENLFN